MQSWLSQTSRVSNHFMMSTFECVKHKRESSTVSVVKDEWVVLNKKFVLIIIRSKSSGKIHEFSLDCDLLKNESPFRHVTVDSSRISRKFPRTTFIHSQSFSCLRNVFGRSNRDAQKEDPKAKGCLWWLYNLRNNAFGCEVLWWNDSANWWLLMDILTLCWSNF